MQNLKISEISIEPIISRQGHLGFASFVINDGLKICNVGIYSCPSSPFEIRLVFPEKKYRDVALKIVFPINQEVYKIMTSAVSEEYFKLMENLG